VKITLRPEAVVTPDIDKKDFTEKVGNVSFDMVYIPGGTFTLGCESGCAPGAAPAIKDVKVSNDFIMKTEVTTALWNVVMGKSGGSTSTSYASATWYDAFEFACKLTQLTGHNYRIMTEAEFEYAAKKPNKSGLLKIGDGSSINGEEWAYNSWDANNHMGGTDPVGPSSGAHTQKTRRDANATGESNITSRLIRSIDGTGPSIRLVCSADVD
jgi:formylglycine-generating enzyme required for sulfatase activity